MKYIYRFHIKDTVQWNKNKKQGLLYHRTCKRDFLRSWPSLNSYLKQREFLHTLSTMPGWHSG